MWSKEWNRFYAHWTLLDGLALVACLGVTAVVAFSLSELLGRLGFRRAQEAYHALFLLAIGTGVHSILPDELRRGSIATAIWLLMAMSVVACVVFRWRRPVRLAASTALVFSPLVPLLVVQILTWSRFGC
jgi:hypothetical protein